MRPKRACGVARRQRDSCLPMSPHVRIDKAVQRTPDFGTLPVHLTRSAPMRRVLRATSSFFLLASLIGLLGCKRIVQEAIKARQRGEEAGALSGAQSEDQALGEKLNGYIRDCLNRYSKS